MQWDASQYAGFSTVETWLPLADDYETVNVEVQRGDSTSMLHYVHALLALRRNSDALTIGSVEIIDAGADEVLAFVREHNDERVLVALNFSTKEHTLKFAGYGETAQVVITTHCDRSGMGSLSHFTLRENEGVVIQLRPGSR